METDPSEQPTEIRYVEAGDEPTEVIRSEEELVVAKETVEHGRIEVRKEVETHPVEVPVDLEREILRVVREPVAVVVGGHDFREQAIEIPLHAQEPRVRKDVVAVERVAIERDVETRHATVSDELRRERVEIREEPGTGR